MLKIVRKPEYFMLSTRFVDDFLCEANGSFVKVYLFVLRHSENPNLQMTDVANALNLLESDVIRAFKYWQKTGLISFRQFSETDFCIEFLDEHVSEDDRSEKSEQLSESKQSRNVTVPTAVSYTKSDISTYMKNNDGIRHMFLISEQLLGCTLTDTDRKILFSFYDYLGMPVEVIFTLLEYCISCGKSNIRYIEKVAYSWADKEINTLAKASVFVKEETEFSALLKKFKAIFKITGRELTNTEESFIKSWVYELKFSDEQIIDAYETTVTNTGKIAFKYMDAVLKNTSTDAKSSFKQHASKTNPAEKRNFFQDYDDEISEFELQMMKKRLNKTN